MKLKPEHKNFEWPAALSRWFSQYCQCPEAKRDWCGVVHIDLGGAGKVYDNCCSQQKHILVAHMLCNSRVLCCNCMRLVHDSRIEDLQYSAKHPNILGQQPYDWIHDKLMKALEDCWQEVLKEKIAKYGITE